MCSICTTSYGPDRYGPQYAGRFGFQGLSPAQMPWLDAKPDPNCPGCRVGAFAAGETRPPMPMAQRPAGQSMPGFQRQVSYIDPSTGLGMAQAYRVEPFGSCPPGTYQTIAGACVPVSMPAGQALNNGPIPSSMASYAQRGRPFYAKPTRGTPMPPGFPLGFLPVGAGLDVPRGMMPMSPPNPILQPPTEWFGFQLK